MLHIALIQAQKYHLILISTSKIIFRFFGNKIFSVLHVSRT